ncbi:MAG: hypothetical protein PHT69_06070 [Bacteroidales bacterium]|nr:hypothetical protein [Bacteroidales bacterium]
MKKSFFNSAALTAIFVSLFLMMSCGEDYYLEKRSGPWKITDVEIAYYKNYDATSDSTITYSSDTLGYFNFYHGTPSKAYVLINYSSAFLTKDYGATYEVHDDNKEMLIISILESTWVDYIFTVKDYNKKKQEWTIVKDLFNGNSVRETISVIKQ